jgi:hypothetical protein
MAQRVPVVTELKRPSLYEGLRAIMRLFGVAIAVLYVLRGGKR